MRRASPPGPAPGETMRDPLTPPSDYLDHAAARRIVGGVLLTMLLAALDQVMVSTALPTIAASPAAAPFPRAWAPATTCHGFSPPIFCARLRRRRSTASSRTFTAAAP